MCSPTAFISLALSAVSTIMESRQQNQAAQVQYDVGAQQYDLTEQNRTLNEQALTARTEELSQDAASEQMALAREAQQVRARQLVANAEAGGGGNTATALLRDVGFRAGLQRVAIDERFTRNVAQIQRQTQANNLNANVADANTTASMRGVRTSSPLGAGLSIAGAGFQAASDGGFFDKKPRSQTGSLRIGGT